MTTGRYEVIGRLPPGQGGKTSLAMMGHGAFRRVVVLRPVGDAALIPVANVHPNLPAPLAVEELDGGSVAVYDFFPGATLHEIFDVYRAQDQLPPLGLAVRIVVDAARVLHVGHEHQDPLGGPGAFVHGGLSDTSLLLGFDGETRVLDFGVRKANRFASPEAAKGGPIDARADVFSLAASLHAALTGFDRVYAAVLQKAPSSAEFAPPSTVHPDASEQLDALLMRALMPSVDRRLASAGELADDLERICGSAMPQTQACATRLRQLFEERLDGLRNMVPRLSSDQASPPRPRPSRASLPAQPPPEPPVPPRKSGPRSPIPPGTQPEANPVGKRATLDVEAAFKPDDDELADERTIVVPDGQLAPKPAPAPRSTGEHKRLERSSGKQKKVPDVPWEQGASPGLPTDPAPRPTEGTAPTADNPVDPALLADAPTGLKKRPSGGTPKATAGGSSRAEKARAVGQELVQTGEVEPFGDDDDDDLRDQPTVVKVSGTHQKLVIDGPVEPFAEDDAPIEPGTAIITSKDGPHAKANGGPPVLHPVDAPEAAAEEDEEHDGPETASLEPEPDTGLLAAAKQKAKPPADAAPDAKKRPSKLRPVIALLMVMIAGGFGFAALKNPEAFRAKVNAALVKWGLKKPPPPPPETPVDEAVVQPPAPLVVADEDGGAAAAPPPELADAGHALEEELSGDAGEEEEDDDGGVTAGDAGTHADGGAVHKVKRKRHRGKKEWWKSQ